MGDPTQGNSKKRDFLLPASILIAALLVSISLVWSAGKKSENTDLSASLNQGAQLPWLKTVSVNIRSVSEDDHVWGDINAPIKIIEYSDFECPYCKVFHPILKQAVSVYGNKVVWVYRHYPIDQLHPKARKEAEASECAAELGGLTGSKAGNDKFWAFVERLYEITPSNNGLDLNLLPQIAEDIGLNRADFENCLSSGKYADRVSNDITDAKNAGARGTPYGIVIAQDGKKYEIPGALPFEDFDPTQPTVKAIIDKVLESE